MKDIVLQILPYIVSVITGVISAAVSIYVCKKNNKIEIDKIELQNKAEFERIQQEHQNELEKIELLFRQEMAKNEQAKKNEMEKKREEIGLNAISSIAENVTGALTNSVLNAPTVKNEINKQASRSFIKKKGKR